MDYRGMDHWYKSYEEMMSQYKSRMSQFRKLRYPVGSMYTNECTNPDSSCLSNSPPKWFTEYMDSLKKDMIKEVSNEVVKNLLEALNKHTAESSYSPEYEEPVRVPFMPWPLLNLHETREREEIKIQAKESNSTDVSSEYENQQLSHSIKRRELNLHETREREETEIQAKESNSTDVSSEYENQQLSHSIKRKEKRVQKKLDRKLQRLQKKKKWHSKEKQVASLMEMFNSLKNNIIEQSINEDPPSPKNKTSTKEEKQEPVQLIEDLIQKLQTAYNVTENDENSQKELNCNHMDNDAACSGSDIDSISTCSDVQSDEQTYEMVQMPSYCNMNLMNNINNPAKVGKRNVENESVSDSSNNEKLNFEHFKENNNESDNDSSSFDLISETPSPPVSIYIDEDHFSSNENISNANVHPDPNLNRVSYVIDVNGKIYNKQLPDENSELEKRAGDTDSFIMETLPMNFKNPSLTESVHTKYTSLISSDLNMDVKNSHTSYPTGIENTDMIRSQELPSAQTCHESQNDLGDFTQSFHSHTTSMTGNDGYASEVFTSHKYTKNVQLDCKENTEANVKNEPRSTNESEKVQNSSIKKSTDKNGDKQGDLLRKNVVQALKILARVKNLIRNAPVNF